MEFRADSAGFSKKMQEGYNPKPQTLNPKVSSILRLFGKSTQGTYLEGRGT